MAVHKKTARRAAAAVRKTTRKTNRTARLSATKTRRAKKTATSKRFEQAAITQGISSPRTNNPTVRSGQTVGRPQGTRGGGGIIQRSGRTGAGRIPAGRTSRDRR